MTFYEYMALQKAFFGLRKYQMLEGLIRNQERAICFVMVQLRRDYHILYQFLFIKFHDKKINKFHRHKRKDPLKNKKTHKKSW